MKSTREVGKKLENYVLAYLQEIDPTARLSNNSGAVSGNGDIIFSKAVVECKKRNTSSITIKRDVWMKLCKSILYNSVKYPLLFIQNKHNEIYAVLQFNDFIRLLKSNNEK